MLERMWWLRPLVKTNKYVIRPTWRWPYRYVSVGHLRQDIERQEQATKKFLDMLAEMIANEVLKELDAQN